MAKVTSVLVLGFFLIISSTAHGLYRNHVQSAGKHLRYQHEGQNRLNPRTNQNSTNITNSLTFEFNASTDITLISNNANGVEIVIDSKAQIVLFYNTSGSGVAFNLTSNVGVVLNGTLNLTNLTSLVSIFNDGARNGTYNLTSVLPQILPILGSLGVNVSSIHNLSYVIRSVTIALQEIGKFSGDVTTNFNGSLLCLVNRLEAIAVILNEIDNATLGLNFTLNLQSILQASNGIRAFIALLEQLPRNINLQVILRNIFQSPRSLQIIVNAFGKSNGTQAFLQAVLELYNLLQNVTNPLQFFHSLVSFFGLGANVSLIEQEINSAIRDLLNANISLDFELRKILSSFLNGSLIVKGINICPLISAAFSSDSRGSIYNVIHIIVLLDQLQIISLNQSLLSLIQQFLNLLPSPGGLFIIRNIISGFNLTADQLTAILTTLRNFGFNFIRLLHGAQNIQDVLSRFPFLGLFFTPINVGLSAYTEGALTLPKIFTPQVIQSAIGNIVQGEAIVQDILQDIFNPGKITAAKPESQGTSTSPPSEATPADSEDRAHKHNQDRHNNKKRQHIKHDVKKHYEKHSDKHHDLHTV